jgi:hypothetical protein
VNEGDGDEEGSEMALFEGFLRGGCGYRCWEVWEWSPRALMTMLVGGERSVNQLTDQMIFFSNPRCNV